MPIDTVKGRELNVLVDRYLSEGVDVNGDINDQHETLQYIIVMNAQRETRLSLQDLQALSHMQQVTRGLIEEATQEHLLNV